ncbi:MAG: S8 family peptidase, partial [Thermodesulfovibrionia bacterium]|nr:S8 family peptidase [Thermodesulfovibrionia bacterium]
FNSAWQQAETRKAVVHAVREGVYVEFKSDPGADLVIKSLEDMSSGKVRLLNVRIEGPEDAKVTYATVYVANEKKNYFLRKIQEYAEKTLESGKPKSEPLINSIADIKDAFLVESFWLDDKTLIPRDGKAWCEVWLSSHKDKVIERFDAILAHEDIEKARGVIKFPERAVKLILADKNQLEKLMILSDDIAEYRSAKEMVTLWLELENEDQVQRAKDLLKRCEVVELNSSRAVCILDTGVNNGHQLLSLILKDEDCQAVDPTWGVGDHKGHGTLVAGIVTYGDLGACLAGTEVIKLRHCLESVKIIPPPPGETKPELWGYVTGQGVSRAEIQSPGRKRILCMTVTAADTRDRGRPSSWSGKIDQLSAGAEDDNKKLFIICSGNIINFQAIVQYPDEQLTDSIHDPAQAWNSIAVGAHTMLDQIKTKSYEGFSPLAPAGGLSPFSTTSLDWDNKWPIKPEIVLEGGNVIHDGQGFWDDADDVSLLTTSHDPDVRQFCKFNMTSAATAKAAWFAAQIQNAYPDIWPETIRALMIHSAEWTDTLKAQFLPSTPKKTDYARLLRICGYGVPNLARALYSGSNSLTLVAQEELQPFGKKENSSNYETKEMHLYALPWPKEVLQDLPDRTKVQMRVTLSYFIEPGPGEKGWKDRYRYASHALRFDVKSPIETNEDFLKRINVAARDENEESPGTQSASDHWMIGKNGRDKGSIHSDIWTGSAAELASSGVISVYPVIGWWRERAYLGCWDKKCRYSLIVSIVTPAEDIDIYTPVAIKVGISTPVIITI